MYVPAMLNVGALHGTPLLLWQHYLRQYLFQHLRFGKFVTLNVPYISLGAKVVLVFAFIGCYWGLNLKF